LYRRVLENNERIKMQQSQHAISLHAVENAKSIFEPAFVGGFQYGDDKHRNTVEQSISQDGADLFWENGTDSQIAIEGLLPTGGRVRFGTTSRGFENSLQEDKDVDQEYDSFLGLNISQPLLKSAGWQSTTTGIRVAEADADISMQTYRQGTMRVLSEAASAYWDLYFAQQLYLIRAVSEQHAQKLLDINQARVKTGKLAETEVLEASSALAYRKSLVSEAKQSMNIAMNTLRSLFSVSVTESNTPIRASDRIEEQVTELNLDRSLDNAFKYRPEYLSAVKRIEREDIKLVFAKNQRWPQLDLKGSYGHNGLAESFGDSYDDIFDESFSKWTVGLEMRIPLGGDRKSRSELLAAKERKRQALLELKAVEVVIANDIDTAIKVIISTQEQVGHFSHVVEMNKRLLTAEVARYKRGKSNSRILLEKEEDLNLAKEAEMKSRVKHQKALLRLTLAEGVVLMETDAEPIKEER